MALQAVSKEELFGILESRVENAEIPLQSQREELRGYARICFERIFFTWELIRKRYTQDQGKILEIGCFPFLLTTALLAKSNDTVTGVTAPENVWPGEPYQVKEEHVTVKTREKEYGFSCWTVNVEKERLPFADQSFDLVICAEVLEHLLHAPAQMFYEINRVLKPQGLLVLTTPNGLYWKYVFDLMFFGVGERYSKYGVYGRHNRLWAGSEIKDILQGNNFRIIEEICNYGRPNALPLTSGKDCTMTNLIQDISRIFFRLAVKLPVGFLRKKNGDQLYVVAQKQSPPREYSPAWLYETNLDRKSVV
jgi:SAM-dependent methyltransferase